MRSFISIVVVALLFGGGCAHKQQRYNIPIDPDSIVCESTDVSVFRELDRKQNYREFLEEIKRRLPIGSSEEEVICLLENIGWNYSYGKFDSSYGLWRDRHRIIVKTRVNIDIYLDSERKVADYELRLTNTAFM